MEGTELLNSRVLVLNRFWQVVNVCSVRRALSLLYLNHAQVVVKQGSSFYTFGFEEWKDFSQENPHGEDEVIRTVSYRIRIPRVILLFLYDSLPPRRVKFTRKNIYQRDNYTCQYCGKKCRPEDLNIDHVIPLSRGGKNTWTNVVCSCSVCNHRKGNKTLEEAGMKLIRKPQKPKWSEFISKKFPYFQNESWKSFLDMAYWNVELEEDK